jgi:hypothetical protein
MGEWTCTFCGRNHAGCFANNCTYGRPWSEREAVVAYLLRNGEEVLARRLARGDHMTAAREGRLDGLRERVRGMVK